VPDDLTSWQFDVASAFLRRATAPALELAVVCRQFPLSTQVAKPEIDFRKASYNAFNLSRALLAASRLLRDSPLGPPISTALLLAVVSAERLRALAGSITLEDTASRQDDRAWTWSEATAAFHAAVQPIMREPARCTWEKMIQGSYMRDLDREMGALIERTTEFVVAPPRPDHVVYVVRRGSAHEEHVRGNRSWCALCGWLDLITVPTDTQRLYHLGYGQTAASGRRP
jgi:hypothetical protein